MRNICLLYRLCLEESYLLPLLQYGFLFAVGNLSVGFRQTSSSPIYTMSASYPGSRSMLSVSSSAPTQPVITTSSSTSLQTLSMHPSSSSTTHPTLFQTLSMLTSSSSTTHPTRTSSYNTLLPLVASAVSIHSSQAGQTGSEPSAVIPSTTNLLTKPTRMSSDKPSFTNLLTKPTRMSSDKPRLSTPVSHTVATLPASSTVVTLIQASNLPTKPEDVCSAIY